MGERGVEGGPSTRDKTESRRSDDPGALEARSAPTVLLVDDNGALLRSVWELIESEFQIVGAVSDGHRLVETAAGFAADVIVLDIAMPEVDGIEAARRLRAAGCPSAIVFLTVHGEPGIVRAALSADGREFVVKSRAAQELIPAVHAAASGERFVSPSVRQSL